MDQLSRYVPNIQILIITSGVPAYILGHNQQTITQDANAIWSLNFVQFKKLKKIALDLDQFVQVMKTSSKLLLFI